MVARSGKRRRAASARLTATVRLLLAVVLALFTFQSTVAYAAALFDDDGAGCCAGSGHDDSDDKPDTCPCPLKCTSGCAGTLRALAPVIAEIQPNVAPGTELVLVIGTADPPSADPFEVLHVPKAGRA